MTKLGETTPQETSETQPESFVEKLVASKGENWRDIETIAKGKVESDEYIAQLERQLEEMREDLGKESFAKQLYDKLTSQVAEGGDAEPKSGQQNSTPEGKEDTTLKPEEIESLISKTLTEKEKAQREEANLRTVNSRLEELYGTEIKGKLAEIKSSLGVSDEYLEQTAKNSPGAFFKLIGEEGPKRESNSVPSNSVNTQAGFDKPSQRDWAYYQKMRRESPNKYYTPAIQRQLLEDKMAMGDSFGN